MNQNPLCETPLFSRRTLHQGLVLTIATATLAFTATAQTAQPWKSIPIPPLHAFHPTEPTQITLPNGVQIFLEEDHELPFTDGFIRIRGGSRDEPADKVGLVNLYGAAWRTSGTATHPGDALDDQLAAKAASIETEGGTAASAISWSSFSSDFGTVFPIVMDILEHPNFKEAKLDLAKQSIATSILRRNDDASSIARREALEIVYGKNNPYAREPQLATISAVTLADLNAWHQKTFVGANIIVAVIGDFNTKDMEAKLRTAFGPIPRGTELVTPKVDFTEPTPGLYYANKSDVDQSNVYMVSLGTEERNPDFYALSVMNEVFSGGFGSRVVQDVRTRLGLAYDVGGSFGAAYDHPGIFAVGLGTKSTSTVAAMQETLKDVGQLRTDPPTPDELRRAKDDLLNSFIFRFDTPEKVLDERVTLAIYGYPSDFLQRYREGVEKVTSADVERVAKKYVQPEKLAIVVVGNIKNIQPPLSTLGKTTKLDISIPGAPTNQ